MAHPLQRGRPEAGRGRGLRHLGRGAGGALGHHPRRRPGDPHHDAVDTERYQRPGGALGAQPLLLEGGPGRAATALHRRHPDHPERRHRGVQPEGDRRRGRLGHHHDQLRLPARLQGERGARQLHRLADSRRRRGPRVRVQPHLQGRQLPRAVQRRALPPRHVAGAGPRRTERGVLPRAGAAHRGHHPLHRPLLQAASGSGCGPSTIPNRPAACSTRWA